MKKFGDIMYKMFPLFNYTENPDNLTEIPTPHKTLYQRFLTIAELEPFGPVDAAKGLGLPVASETLESLASASDEEITKRKEEKVVVGLKRRDDRFMFKFTASQSGHVGFRYGASRRDRKKDRAVAFDQQGKLIYV